MNVKLNSFSPIIGTHLNTDKIRLDWQIETSIAIPIIVIAMHIDEAEGMEKMLDEIVVLDGVKSFAVWVHW